MVMKNIFMVLKNVLLDLAVLLLDCNPEDQAPGGRGRKMGFAS